MKIAIVLGTRPEIIKLSPIIRYCKNKNLDYFILHSNQHYSEKMDAIFFSELKLPQPDYNLGVGSGSHGEQTGRMMIEMEKIFLKEKPDVIIIQGDTNTTLAGALVGRKLQRIIAHVEAGLRSRDWKMAEEHNRVIADHLSDYLFAPTDLQEKNLMKEGIDKKKIFVVGNTIVDALNQNLELSREKEDIFSDLDIKKGEFFLATIHRAENVDTKIMLKNILASLDAVSKHYNHPVVYPIHPRTKKMIEKFGLDVNSSIILTEPLGYFKFLQLLQRAKAVLTDSGGIQEEACILKVPCVTLRENTERPETIEVGANVLAGTDPQRVLKGLQMMLSRQRSWKNPFGSGDSGQRIIDTLIKNEI